MTKERGFFYIFVEKLVEMLTTSSYLSCLARCVDVSPGNYCINDMGSQLQYLFQIQILESYFVLAVVAK
jgi:hypothetical protein